MGPPSWDGGQESYFHQQSWHDILMPICKQLSCHLIDPPCCHHCYWDTIQTQLSCCSPLSSWGLMCSSSGKTNPWGEHKMHSCDGEYHPPTLPPPRLPNLWTCHLSLHRLQLVCLLHFHHLQLACLLHFHHLQLVCLQLQYQYYHQWNCKFAAPQQLLLAICCIILFTHACDDASIWWYGMFAGFACFVCYLESLASHQYAGMACLLNFLTSYVSSICLLWQQR
jgi:hypothetical protein